MKLRELDLNENERRTFYIHLAYSVLNGFILGVLALNEFVFIKSLHGTNFQLGFLFQFNVVVFSFIIFVNQFLKRIQNKRKLLFITGVSTHLPLIFLFFFPETTSNGIYNYLFLFIFLIYFMGNPVIMPLINQFLKNSYSHEHFSTLYSYATSLNKITMLVVTFGYGLWLDYDNYSFTIVFPVVAILGIAATYLLSKIEYRHKKSEEDLPRETVKESIKASVKDMLSILRHNTPYLHFEIGFMLYGAAFMLSMSVITIFFNDFLLLNYSSVAFYRNGYNVIAILLLPFFGRLLGKIDPRLFAAITYFSMFCYILCVIFTEYMPYYFDIFGIRIYYMLILYMICHGVFAATMSLLWSIGSAYFCCDEDVAQYQSVHLSLVGLRALFAPLAGIWLYETIGYLSTFLIAAGLLMLAISVMLFSWFNTSGYKKNHC
ncbi:membrane hypothetical protein [Desulfamplus magnetovallimortis]|uniref:Major facilitator superfamily MFS_1 n=1 Tax=Desulfamplus magnetovallimortis TaxID=1246637 RepID=A0A1W1HJE3_9BACT|nr:MFS transporter [Desulfamplus magnetovallimortis]SLM32478.1 membrane hypothetical protein [Desulfamplus magnetovallimortis]